MSNYCEIHVRLKINHTSVNLKFGGAIQYSASRVCDEWMEYKN